MDTRIFFSLFCTCGIFLTIKKLFSLLTPPHHHHARKKRKKLSAHFFLAFFLISSFLFGNCGSNPKNKTWFYCHPPPFLSGVMKPKIIYRCHHFLLFSWDISRTKERKKYSFLQSPNIKKLCRQIILPAYLACIIKKEESKNSFIFFSLVTWCFWWWNIFFLLRVPTYIHIPPPHKKECYMIITMIFFSPKHNNNNRRPLSCREKMSPKIGATYNLFF